MSCASRCRVGGNGPVIELNIKVLNASDLSSLMKGKRPIRSITQYTTIRRVLKMSLNVAHSSSNFRCLSFRSYFRISVDARLPLCTSDPRVPDCSRPLRLTGVT